jgi:hypothetical protein
MIGRIAAFRDRRLAWNVWLLVRRRFAVYDEGVPEVWVWTADALTIHVLSSAGRYEARSDSAVLSGFPLTTAAEFLGHRHTMSDTELVRRFREAIRG